jgi:hypothetical protein
MNSIAAVRGSYLLVFVRKVLKVRFFRFIEELEEGIYIQQSLETVFMDTEGKQVRQERGMGWVMDGSSVIC